VPLKGIDGAVCPTDHGLSGRLQPVVNTSLRRGPTRLDTRPGGIRAERHPVPDLDCHVFQQVHGVAEPTGTSDKAGELIDQFARADDQRADAGPEQRGRRKTRPVTSPLTEKVAVTSPATHLPAITPAKVTA